MRPALAAMPLLILALVALPAAAQSSSTSYILQQSSLESAGDAADSFGYRLTGSFGQSATVGVSSSFRFVLQSGFWSHVGSGLVPVFLTAQRNKIDPENVDLQWSGNNEPYEIYRSDDCSDVFASYLDQSVAKSYTDTTAPDVVLLCYSVLATAPGLTSPLPSP